MSFIPNSLKSDLEKQINKKENNIIFTPEELKNKFPFLRKYQREDIITYFISGNIFNCNDMGLGKTIETGTYIKLTNPHKTLIIVPKSIIKQWQIELYNFFDLETYIIPDNPNKRKEIYNICKERIKERKSYILIINYAKLLTTDFEEFYSKRFFNLLVLDEITKIKDGRTKIHKAIKKLKVGKIVGLTGTPVENNIQELYSLMNVIDYRFFGKFSEFAKEYLKINYWGGYETKSGAPKKLGMKMKKFERFIRWKKKDVLKELPDIIQNSYRFKLSEEERSYYNGIISKNVKIYNKKGGIIDLSNILSVIQVLRRAVSDLSIYFESKTSSKRDLLLEIFEEYLNYKEKNKKIVCFSQYKDIIYNYTEFLKKNGIKALCITGDHSATMKEQLLEKFKTNNNIDVLMSTDIFSYGINLQEASYLINIDIPWNPAILKQRIGRLHRIGQKNVVNVINLIAENSIEEKVVEKILGKIKMFDEIITINEKSILTFVQEEIKKERKELEKNE